MEFWEGAAIETGADGCYLRYYCGTCYGFRHRLKFSLGYCPPIHFIFYFWAVQRFEFLFHSK